MIATYIFLIAGCPVHLLHTAMHSVCEGQYKACNGQTRKKHERPEKVMMVLEVDIWVTH